MHVAEMFYYKFIRKRAGIEGARTIDRQTSVCYQS